MAIPMVAPIPNQRVVMVGGWKGMVLLQEN